MHAYRYAFLSTLYPLVYTGKRLSFLNCWKTPSNTTGRVQPMFDVIIVVDATSTERKAGFILIPIITKLLLYYS